LIIGNEIASLDGSNGTVEAIVVEARTEIMYDLTVEEVHTFAVGQGEWMAHNQDLIYDKNGLIIGIRGQIPKTGMVLPRAIQVQELVNLYNGHELGLAHEIVLPNGVATGMYMIVEVKVW
jgi:hypothetical protein